MEDEVRGLVEKLRVVEGHLSSVADQLSCSGRYAEEAAVERTKMANEMSSLLREKSALEEEMASQKMKRTQQDLIEDEREARLASIRHSTLIHNTMVRVHEQP
jgi:hypothetical protein